MKHLLVILMIVPALYCRAESPFRQYIAMAVGNSLEVASTEARNEAAYINARAENSLDGPEIEFEHMWASASSDTKWNIGLTQEISFPGLYRARSQAADSRAEASAVVLFGIKADKALNAKLAILDIINAHARRKLYAGINDNLSRIADLTRRQYDSGNATILSLRKMQLAVLDNESAIAGIDTDIKALSSALAGNGVLVPPAGAELWDAYPLQAFDKDDTATESYLHRLAEATDRANRAEAHAVRMQAWPTLAVSYRHAFEEGQHFNGLAVSLRLPSFSQSKRRRAAALEAHAATLDVIAVDRQTNTEETGLKATVEKLGEEIARYRDLLGDDSYLQLLAKAYDGGELNVIDYLQEINLYTESRLNYLDLLYRYNLALARLNRYRSMDF